jgi:hypothetical protein
LICERCRESAASKNSKHCSRCSKEDRLLRESVTSCPPFLTIKDFHKFMRKLAVHAHAGRSSEAKPVTLQQMQERLTEAILRALPLYYVSMLEYDRKKQESTGVIGSYTFKAKLPQNVLYKTVEKLEIWKPIDPGEGERYDAGFGG